MGDEGRAKRRLTIMALVGLIAVLAMLAFFGSTSGNEYVGSDTCGNSGCHKGTYEDWEETMHGIDFSEWRRGGTADPENKYTRSGGNETTGEFGSCAPCHVVGWDDSENGGTDPEQPWNSTHNLPLGSIGCENCHGPGGDHADSRDTDMLLNEFTYSLSCAGWSTVSNDERPGAEYDGETIQMCHDGYRMGGNPDTDPEAPGYYESVHAGGIGSSSPKGNPECYHCMAAQGFIDVNIGGQDPPDEEDFEEVDGKWYIDDEEVIYGIYCGVCHNVHPDKDAEEIEFQLRAPAEELCEKCHYNTHIFPDTHVRHPTTEFRHGINGKDVPVTSYMEEVSCPECHMWSSAGHGDPPVSVGHSFMPNPLACVACHSMYTNETAQEAIDTIHEEFEALIAPFGNETTGLIGEATEHMEWADANDLWTDDLNMTYLEAIWNYEYPNQDGSEGMHNPPFMRAMFASATEKLEMVIEDTSMGKVMGTVKWKDGDAISGAKIMDGAGTELGTTDAGGNFSFYYGVGTWTFIVMDSEGKDLGTTTVEVKLMQEVTSNVEFEPPTSGDGNGGDGDGDGEEDEETDMMTYVFLGIIVVLIIIIIAMALMGGKGGES